MTPATLTPNDAYATIRNFIEASNRKDLKAMERYLTKKTVESGQYHSDAPDLERYEFRGAVPEGNSLVVAVELFIKNAPAGQPPSMVMPFVMVPEDGAYKIDLPATMDKLFGGDLEKLMQQMAETMKTAMEGMGNALAAGLNAALEGTGSPEPAAKKSKSGQGAVHDEKPRSAAIKSHDAKSRKSRRG